jgi:hypothetical protein
LVFGRTRNLKFKLVIYPYLNLFNNSLPSLATLSFMGGCVAPFPMGLGSVAMRGGKKMNYQRFSLNLKSINNNFYVTKNPSYKYLFKRSFSIKNYDNLKEYELYNKL